MTLNESISSAPFGERFNYASRTRLYPFQSKSCARAEFVLRAFRSTTRLRAEFVHDHQRVKPLPDKVQAVLDYKQPETVGSLRKFLGLLNFYRRFLPKAAEQQYLLSEFLKGSKALADAALLAHSSPSAPLALDVDASDYAIGGALHQVVDSELQPLAFFSRKLTSSEKSYSAYDRELLAIYSAIRHFRYMLEARDFTVFTDHKPLTYAFRQKSDKCSPRQIRQLDFISQFTTNIVHFPGSDNIAADVLSRVSAITFPSQIDYDCIAETQQTDQELHTLIASGTSLELKR
ncbi:hypothetical protein TNCV_1116501 [Trichonephila clavipes]|nr:hypothetical protein TNCV_1116501 [Trichonephila clavipes]